MTEIQRLLIHTIDELNVRENAIIARVLASVLSATIRDCLLPCMPRFWRRWWSCCALKRW